MLPIVRCWLLVAAFLLIAVSIKAQPQPVTVVRVLDGDTFALSDGRKVRLIGIDTPERFYSQKLLHDAERDGQDAAVIQALGERAARYAETLVLGRPVRLAYDSANAAAGHRDRYGRTLAYIQLLQAAHEAPLDVNEHLLASGYARAYVRYPFSKTSHYLTLQQEARQQRKGLWDAGHGSVEVFSVPVVQVAHEQVVYVTRTGTRYHREACRYLRKSKTALSLPEALARYAPCKVCAPPVE